MGAHKEQGKAWSEDDRHDLELKIVMWGRIEGGDRSKLSRGHKRRAERGNVIKELVSCLALIASTESSEARRRARRLC